MHIIFDARAARPQMTGIARATLGLLGGLHSVDHDHRITVLCHPAYRSSIKTLRVEGDERFRLRDVPVEPFSFTRQLTLPRRLGRLRADVWHAPFYVRPLLGLPPTVVTAYDLIRPGEGQPGARRLQSPAPALKWAIKMRLSLGLAAHVITPSEATKKEIQESLKIPPERLSVVALAADEHFRPPPRAAVEDVRRRLGLGERYVVYLGTNKPHKNLDSLVASWGILARENAAGGGGARTTLLIAGREDPRAPSSRERYAAQAEGLRLRFISDVPDDDLPALLGGALCLVSPSLKEGFNLTPLEAMACGTPVVTSNHPTAFEVVGDAGIIVEPTPEALACGLRRLLGDEGLRRETAARGLARAAQFSWRRAAEQTLRVYEHVARERGAGA